MHDQHGMLLVKAQRSKNELYKVRMGIKKAVQLNLAYISESNRWHTRLGHVNHDTTKIMIKRELVSGIPNVNVEWEEVGTTRGRDKRAPSLFLITSNGYLNYPPKLLNGPNWAFIYKLYFSLCLVSFLGHISNDWVVVIIKARLIIQCHYFS